MFQENMKTKEGPIQAFEANVAMSSLSQQSGIFPRETKERQNSR